MNAETDIEMTKVDEVLAIVHKPYLGRARAYPFLKWAGGKRALVPEIAKRLPDSFNDYYEPFLGGGAVFFSLDSRINRKAVLSDLNTELILTYKMLQKDPQAVIEKLKHHQLSHCKDYYNKVRDEGHFEQDAVCLAARLVYLNRTCYNGLYRVNKKGKFNVPMGSYKNPRICDTDNLLSVSEVLQSTNLLAKSFEQIQPSNGDVVYCDPPYDETFTAYTDKGFDTDAQTLLRKTCDGWRQAGAHVIVSNSDTEFIHKAWRGYKIDKVSANRNINSNANGRSKVTELLIVGTAL